MYSNSILGNSRQSDPNTWLGTPSLKHSSTVPSIVATAVRTLENFGLREVAKQAKGDAGELRCKWKAELDGGTTTRKVAVPAGRFEFKKLNHVLTQQRGPEEERKERDGSQHCSRREKESTAQPTAAHSHSKLGSTCNTRPVIVEIRLVSR